MKKEKKKKKQAFVFNREKQDYSLPKQFLETRTEFPGVWSSAGIQGWSKNLTKFQTGMDIPNFKTWISYYFKQVKVSNSLRNFFSDFEVLLSVELLRQQSLKEDKHYGNWILSKVVTHCWSLLIIKKSKSLRINLILLLPSEQQIKCNTNKLIHSFSILCSVL